MKNSGFVSFHQVGLITKLTQIETTLNFLEKGINEKSEKSLLKFNEKRPLTFTFPKFILNQLLRKPYD